jgi:hypothetical protein
VATKISQRKKAQKAWGLNAIFNTSRVQPATLAEDSPTGHHQAIASNIYRSTI